jgi:hypothetical protein
MPVGLSNTSTHRFQVSSFSAPASAAAHAHCPIGCQLEQRSTAQKVDFTQRTGAPHFVLPQISYRLTFLALHLTDLSYSKKI